MMAGKFEGSIAALLLLVTTTAVAQTRTVAPVEGGSDTMTLEIDGRSADGVHIKEATLEAVSGKRIKWGTSNSEPEARRIGVAGNDVISLREAVASSPGTLTLTFAGEAGGACPFAVDAVKPVKSVGIVIKKNRPPWPTDRYMLSGVTVTRCDGGGATIGYQSLHSRTKSQPTNE